MKIPIMTAQSRYGAFELKATYQRNMMLGTLIMFTFVTLSIFGGWVYSILMVDIIEITPPPIRDPRIIEIDLTETPFNVVPEKTIGSKKAGYKPKTLKGSIPRPVAIDEAIDDDVLLDSKEDIRDFLNYLNNPGDGIGDVPGIGEISGNNLVFEEGDKIPSMQVFIPRQSEPVMIYNHQPEYPSIAKMAGMEADVWVSAYVDKNGEVKQALVGRTTGGGLGFEEAAIAAAYLCQYKPAINNKYPIGVWVTYKVEFRLRDK